ncbi:MAG: hypothetical protein N3D82_04060 [Ignisphaera sp.]|nr:hypothetical protein [Ignisphaera sp.]MCX8168182.1 hypothetical protein [Ignisphaera sp.]MDW8084947.1 hypothetical protein [Ignisphaera sp.]
MSIKAKLLLSLALLREFHNKVEYYKSVVKRNVHIYKGYKMQSSDSGKVRAIEREIAGLENIYRQLDNISIFLEYIILRLETLITANNVTVSIAMMRDVVKVLKNNTSKTIPILTTLVDRLDELTRTLVSETQSSFQSKNVVNTASLEAKKIVEEAKKVAGVQQ